MLTAYQQLQYEQSTNKKIASVVITSAASNISYQLSELKRNVNLLAQSNNALLQKLYSEPGNKELQATLNDLVAHQFPRSFAVTLAASNGEVLLDNFEGFIGEVCLNDIMNFSKTGNAPPAVVHPNPDGYHIDIMTRISIDDTTSAILFISFYAEMFSPLLQQQHINGLRFLITNSTEGKLIEITSGGSRKHLGVNPNLSDEELGKIIASTPVQGALWNVIALPEGDAKSLFSRGISSSLLWMIAFIVMFSILSAFLAYRKRRQFSSTFQDDSDPEDISLYRRAQCAQPLLEILSRTEKKASLHATMHQCLSHLLKLSHSQHGMILETSGPSGQRHSVHILSFLLANDMLASSAHLNTQSFNPDQNSTIGHALDHIETIILEGSIAREHSGLPAGYPDIDSLFVRSIEFNGRILGVIVLTNWDSENKDKLEDYSAIMDFCATCLQAHKH